MINASTYEIGNYCRSVPEEAKEVIAPFMEKGTGDSVDAFLGRLYRHGYVVIAQSKLNEYAHEISDLRSFIENQKEVE